MSSQDRGLWNQYPQTILFDGAKSIGLGTATISLSGAAVSLGNVFCAKIRSGALSPSMAKPVVGYEGYEASNSIYLMLEGEKERQIGPGAATIALAGAAIGIVNLCCALVHSAARNPS